jgi:GT2 family glycosyltransferase
MLDFDPQFGYWGALNVGNGVSAAPPGVSVIILNHDKAAYTRACLRSLLTTRDAAFEVIAVDNGSTDSTPQALEAFQQEAAQRGIACRILRNPTNVGAIVGRNQAMEIARGEFFVFMDNDVLVKDRDWMTHLRVKLEGDPRTAIISPKLLFPWEPYLIEFAGCEVSPTGRVGYAGRGEARDDPRFNVEREVPCVISACILFRRKLVEEIGPLDEAFNPVQFEDLDLCYRARAAGYKILYAPDVEMFHFEHVTTDGSTGINFKYVTVKNGLLFKKRYQQVFARDGGPPDAALKWKQLKKKPIEEVDVEALLNSQALTPAPLPQGGRGAGVRAKTCPTSKP